VITIYCPACGSYRGNSPLINEIPLTARVKCDHCHKLFEVKPIDLLTIENIVDRIRNNETKIQLIKELRNEQGFGLKDSKAVIDLLDCIFKGRAYSLNIEWSFDDTKVSS